MEQPRRPHSTTRSFDDLKARAKTPIHLRQPSGTGSSQSIVNQSASFDQVAAQLRPHGYELIRIIGQGGMGIVYLANQLELNRRVALKQLHPQLTRNDNQFHQVLIREAQLQAQINDKNVINLYGVLTISQSTFIVMEYMDSSNLKDWIHLTRPDIRVVLDALIEAGNGIRAIHGAGILHRDIKPSNILVAPRGNPWPSRVCITDFGISRFIAIDQGTHHLTSDLSHWGSSGYRSPEATPTPQSDIYSFCASMYTAIHGIPPSRPFEYSDSGPPSPKIPMALSGILLRGLQREPANRFRDMQELLAALNQATTELWGSTTRPAAAPQATVAARPSIRANLPATPPALPPASRPQLALPGPSQPPKPRTMRRTAMLSFLPFGVLALILAIVWKPSKPAGDETTPVAAPTPTIAISKVVPPNASFAGVLNVSKLVQSDELWEVLKDGFPACTRNVANAGIKLAFAATAKNSQSLVPTRLPNGDVFLVPQTTPEDSGVMIALALGREDSNCIEELTHRVAGQIPGSNSQIHKNIGIVANQHLSYWPSAWQNPSPSTTMTQVAQEVTRLADTADFAFSFDPKLMDPAMSELVGPDGALTLSVRLEPETSAGWHTAVVEFFLSTKRKVSRDFSLKVEQELRSGVRDFDAQVYSSITDLVQQNILPYRNGGHWRVSYDTAQRSDDDERTGIVFHIEFSDDLARWVMDKFVGAMSSSRTI